MATRGGSKIFFSSFEMKSCIKNHVVVLKKLYQTKIIDLHYLFSNPPKTMQFWLLAVPVTLLSILSARQLISKIWETLTRVSDPSTRCKKFKFNGWELWIFRGGNRMWFLHYGIRDRPKLQTSIKIFLDVEQKIFLAFLKLNRTFWFRWV